MKNLKIEGNADMYKIQYLYNKLTDIIRQDYPSAESDIEISIESSDTGYTLKGSSDDYRYECCFYADCDFFVYSYCAFGYSLWTSEEYCFYECEGFYLDNAGRLKLAKIKAEKSGNFTESELNEYFMQIDELEELRKELKLYNGKNKPILPLEKMKKKYKNLYFIEPYNHGKKYINISVPFNPLVGYIGYEIKGDNSICYLHIW